MRLGPACGHPVRQGTPKIPVQVRPETGWAANVAQGWPPDLTSARPRLHPDLRPGIFAVVGSAMHMKCPDDIGREAGIVRTRIGKDVSDTVYSGLARGDWPSVG